MVLFGKKWLYSGKVVDLGQKLLYTSKSAVFGQNWLNSAKLVISNKVVFILAK